MITILNLPLYLMETLNCWSSPLHGYVMFMFLTTISRGLCSGCDAPSTPWCFRRNDVETVYICEWSMNSNEHDVTFDLYFNETKFANIKNTWHTCIDELLIKSRPVDIWVEARVGDSSCSSPRRSVVLKHIIKYQVPQNISLSWLKNNLTLCWRAAEKTPALAEVRFRRDDHPSDSWENRSTSTTVKASMYQVIIANLLKNSAYRVQIRQQSTVAQDPLWSDWSEVVIVPAELEHKPEVTVTRFLVGGTRKVVLTWKPVPNAAAVSGVTYSLNDTQSSHSCPCEEKGHHTNTNEYTIYLSNSAANISIKARNAAGLSPTAVVQVPAEPATDLKACDKTLVHEKLHKRTCLELYELQYEDLRPSKGITLSGKAEKSQKKQARESIQDNILYLYFEHRCKSGKPQTVKMCLYYHKERVPRNIPQDFKPSDETHNSVHLSWKPIPLVDHQGFLTCYKLCVEKISSEYESIECYNITASATEYRLENLTPGTRYNISLAGVTRVGEGPLATVVVNTFPEKPLNVWLSFSFLFVFFLLSTTCTIILKRVQNKIFPPVPTPVIPDFTLCQPDPEMSEKKEVVHQLTLHQLHSEGKSLYEEAEEATVLTGEWDEGTDEDVDNERSYLATSSDECASPGSTDQALRNSGAKETMGLEQVDTELALLIYRNGLVFDVKTDSS